MKTYGGSEFNDTDFLLFGKKIKELTYNTFLEVALKKDESPGYRDHVKEELRKYKVHIKEELLDSYGKKSKFNELNDMIVDAAKSEGYQEVAHSGSDELYDFTGLTEKILKKIGISYVLTPGDLDSIRNVLESSGSRAPSRTSSIRSRTSSIRSRTSSIRSRTSSIRSRTSSSSSRGRTKKKKKSTKKKKKKPTKKKKKYGGFPLSPRKRYPLKNRLTGHQHPWAIDTSFARAQINASKVPLPGETDDDQIIMMGNLLNNDTKLQNIFKKFAEIEGIPMKSSKEIKKMKGNPTLAQLYDFENNSQKVSLLKYSYNEYMAQKESSSRGSTKKKKKKTKGKKKKPTKKKKKKLTKGRKRTLKKRGGRPENIEVELSYGENLGVDFYVSSENKLCEVKSVIAGGKADSSGVEPGHHLKYLNDTDVRSLTQAEIHHLEKRNTVTGYLSGITDKFVFGLDQFKSMDQNCPEPLILKQNTNTKTDEEIIENMVKFLNISSSKSFTDWISWEESFAHDTGGVSDEDKIRRLQKKWKVLWAYAIKKYEEKQALIREKTGEYYSGKNTIETFVPEGGFGLNYSAPSSPA